MIEGSLGDVSPSEVCRLIASGARSGILNLNDRTRIGYIQFERGDILSAAVVNRSERLGNLLVRRGLIEPHDLEEAIRSQSSRPDARLGEILVDSGKLAREALDAVVREQTREAVLDLLAWREGSYRFEERDAQESIRVVSSVIPTLDLVNEGVRRAREWTSIERRIPHFGVVLEVDSRFQPGPGDFKSIPLSSTLYPLIDGIRSVARLVEETGHADFAVAQSLHAMLHARWIRLLQTDAPSEGVGEGDPGTVHQNGISLLRSGRRTDAEGEFRRALELDPGRPDSTLALAELLMEGGRQGELMDLLEAPETSRWSPRQRIVRSRFRALALERIGDLPGALAELDRAASIEAPDPRHALHRALLLLRTGRPAETLEELDRWRSADPSRVPEPAVWHSTRILALAMSGDVRGAAQCGLDALQLHPRHPVLLLHTGAILERLGDLEAAESCFTRAATESLPLAQIWKNLGDIAWRKGNEQVARAHYERAVQLDPWLGDDLYVKLGTLAFKEGDRALAAILWSRALEIRPDNSIARTNLRMAERG